MLPIAGIVLLRAVALLVVVVALSVAATLAFGQEVLIALGFILVQLKLIAKALAGLKLPAFAAWLKTHAETFLRVELLKKWVTGSILPLIVGNAVLRRIAGFADGYKAQVQRRYRAMLTWYAALPGPVRIVAALCILFATLALSVTTVGLWLILFSVQLPLWVAASLAAMGRMIVSSVEKSVFRAVAFLQLSWAWRAVRRLLPERLLARKRRFDYRVARAVVRRRRMTLRQLEAQRDSLPFRLGLMLEYWSTSSPGSASPEDAREETTQTR